MQRKIFWLLSLLSFLISCKQEESNIGKQFVDVHSRVVRLDTMRVDVSTVLLDSITTSGKELALIGCYNDGEFGTITASTYCLFTYPAISVLNSTCEYDSATISIYPNGYYYGDTMELQSISVYRLKDDITLDEDGYLYNTSHFTYDSVSPIAKTNGNIKLRPSKKQKVEMRVSDELGIDLFDRAKNIDDIYDNSTNFFNYFKGICIKSSSSSSAILGYTASDTSLMMNIYYHTTSTGVQSRLKFQLSGSSYQFNHISVDRSKTLLKNLKKGNMRISADSTNNEAFTQCGTGLVMRIDFPNLKDLHSLWQYATIAKAQLIVRPIKQTYNEIALPDTMYVYKTDYNNNFLSAITDGNGYSLTGSLYIENIYQEETRYTYDITSYIKALMNDGDFSDYGLLMISPKLSTSFERAILGNSQNEQNKIELIIYYMIYEE
jgi:hypothetical protein